MRTRRVCIIDDLEVTHQYLHTKLDARDTRTEWLASEMWAGTPKSAVQKQFLVDRRATGTWRDRGMGGVAGLALDAYGNL